MRYLEEDANFCASLELSGAVLRNSKVAVGFGLPQPLLVVIVLGDNLHIVSHQEDGVKANAKLPNKVDIPALLELV